ncbi:hypothetical protein GCM10022267_90680 [Lentzea roselyniae]|uniref:Uncharacterized protein n=1 Tax=Lentzea roselyniae TaxID=531940 RepID=A0ABP7CG49_9PSEU
MLVTQRPTAPALLTVLGIYKLEGSVALFGAYDRTRRRAANSSLPYPPPPPLSLFVPPMAISRFTNNLAARELP